MPMKLILTEDVETLGHRGDVVTVTPGYGRNFLLPQGKALVATEANIRSVEVRKKRIETEKIKEKEEAEVLAGRIGRISVTIPRKVGENDALYGSVTSHDIAAALELEGVVVDRRKIVLEEPIKALGVVSVPLRVHPEVQATIKVWVVKE